MNKIKLIFIILLCSVKVVSQSKIKVHANFTDAQFFKMNGNTIVKPAIGTGSIELKLDKNDVNRIFVFKEGYNGLVKEFPRTQKWPKEVNVLLEDRVVELIVEPYDANIYVDGQLVGTKNYNLVIKKDKSATVEIKKSGFKTITKHFYNADNKELAPLTSSFKLEDKLVQIKVSPADAEIYVNKILQGIGSADVQVPKNECVVVEARKEGYIIEEKVFCNKENDVAPPINYNFVLKDRLVKIEATPKDAEILVDGKIVGVGSYDLKVTENNCVKVVVKKESFLPIEKNYCNSKDYQDPPFRDHLELIEDEAFKMSISTDLANVNFTINISPGITEDGAWKLLSSIVTTEFDVLEVTDKETGYLRTAWQVQAYNGSTIRTRVIVKLGDSNPLKYLMKISSERADGLRSVKEDQYFSEWNRILKKYQNIIEEAQSRM